LLVWKYQLFEVDEGKIILILSPSKLRKEVGKMYVTVASDVCDSDVKIVIGLSMDA